MTRCSACGAVLATGDPSPAELRVLNAVLDFHEKHGRFPKYKEVQRALGLVSTNAVFVKVRSLSQKGFLTLEHRRGIKAARRAA